LQRPSRRVNVPDGFSSSEDISPQRREVAPYQAPPPVVASISEGGDALSASSNASRYVKLLHARLQAQSSPPSSALQDSGAGVGGASLSPSRIQGAPSYDGIPVRVVTSSSGSNASRYSQMLAQRALRMQEQRQPAALQASMQSSPFPVAASFSPPRATLAVGDEVRFPSFVCCAS
jgi:hypothetical protein